VFSSLMSGLEWDRLQQSDLRGFVIKASDLKISCINCSSSLRELRLINVHVLGGFEHITKSIGNKLALTGVQVHNLEQHEGRSSLRRRLQRSLRRSLRGSLRILSPKLRWPSLWTKRILTRKRIRSVNCPSSLAAGTLAAATT